MHVAPSTLLALVLATSVFAVPNPENKKPPAGPVVFKTVVVKQGAPSNPVHDHQPQQHQHHPQQQPAPHPTPGPAPHPAWQPAPHPAPHPAWHPAPHPAPQPAPQPAPKAAPKYPSPAPKPPASKWLPPLPGGGGNNNGQPPYMQVVNQYRMILGMKPLQWDEKLEQGAQRVVHTCNGAQFHNDGHDGWRGQVLCPAGQDKFQEVFLFGWLCEKPTLPGISALCPMGQSLFEHLPGVTGHADILTDPSMTRIGCGWFKNIWGCDLA